MFSMGEFNTDDIIDLRLTFDPSEKVKLAESREGELVANAYSTPY